jgi:hypothetical protein
VWRVFRLTYTSLGRPFQPLLQETLVLCYQLELVAEGVELDGAWHPRVVLLVGEGCVLRLRLREIIQSVAFSAVTVVKYPVDAAKENKEAI